MFKKLLRIALAIIGALIGYGISIGSKYLLIHSDSSYEAYFKSNYQYILAVIISLLFAIMFYRLAPLISEQSVKVAGKIEDDLQGVSGNDILAGAIGLIFGLIIAFFITQIFAGITNQYLYVIITLIVYMIMGFIGVVVANKKGKEIISQMFTARRNSDAGPNANPAQATRFSVGGKGRKQSNIIPKILDTSVIIDGRIAEIIKTGFLEGPIVIPEFVLVELRHIADSSDSLKRTRGRRGLDILNRIQTDYGIDIYNTESEKGLKEIPEVDVKLLKLAQIMGGKVVTNDFNLNKVARINGVDVLNINELANTLKPVVIPGEKMTVTPVKQGKDSQQSIAYLDDGTMVVLEDGKNYIGKTREITVTSVLQTSAGRMIFGRVRV
ncbi:MAG: PIN domain-containing protein [[Eubacterium] sulci]|nr:PIN domain-containing protein [[Eubacterium] sulci]